MPVTARLLQRLQETLGDDATNDLFRWIDEAGWVNRGAVREIADLYFERFEGRLEQGLGEVRAELRQQVARLERGLAEVQVRLEARLEQGLAEVRSELRQEVARLEARTDTALANQRSDLLKWMFIFWVGTIVPLAGLILTVSRL